jgi:hypothetical protein
MGGGWTHWPAVFNTTCPGRSAGAPDGGGFGGVSCAQTVWQAHKMAMKMTVPIIWRENRRALWRSGPEHFLLLNLWLKLLRPGQNTRSLLHNCERDRRIDRSVS